LGILAVRSHAHMQRAQPSQRQEAVEWRTGDPHAIPPPLHQVVQFGRRCNDGSADDVTVAVQVLRRRMKHQIRTEFERALPDRRQERIVGDDDRAHGFGS
jgi:hypothetical protein